MNNNSLSLSEVKIDVNDIENRRRLIQSKIHNKEKKVDDEINNKWQSCCNKTTDKRLLRYISTSVISGSILTLSIVKLMSDIDCEDKNLYVGLLTMVLGIYIKSPIF
jgi:membrane-bound ClpP family serine protease